MTGKELTIASPAYNEGEALAAYFERIDFVRAELERRGWTVSQLLINDGSSDGTRSLLDGYARGRQRVRVVSHPVNLGYGGAIKTAMALARTPWLAFVDVDSNYDQAIILDLVDLDLGSVDIVNVSVFAPGGAQGYPWHRKALSRSASLLYALLLPRLTRGVYTMTCGFRLYRTEVLTRILPRIDNFAATSESMLRALLAGLRVREFPATNRDRDHGVSKMRFWSNTLRHFGLAAAARLGALGPPPSPEEHLRRVGLSP